MYFRSQKKSAQDVSLSDYIETGTDGAALSLMDVVAEDSDLLERISTKEQIQQLRSAVDTALTAQEKEVVQLRYPELRRPERKPTAVHPSTVSTWN